MAREYSDAIARYTFLIPCVRAATAALDAMTGKNFDIRNVQTLCDAIKKETGTEAYPYKGTNYNGETYYSITLQIPGTTERTTERFDTQYSHEGTQAERFRNIFKRFDGLEEWKEEAQKKLDTLEERHAEASKLLAQLEPLSDLF